MKVETVCISFCLSHNYAFSTSLKDSVAFFLRCFGSYEILMLSLNYGIIEGDKIHLSMYRMTLVGEKLLV